MRKIIIISTLCLILCGCQSKATKQESYIEKLSYENRVIMEDKIELEGFILSLENEIDSMLEENELLQDTNHLLLNDIKILEENIDEYKDTFEEQNFRIEHLKFEISSKLVYYNILIDLNLTENRAIELFGQPIKENIEIIGSDGIWYLEGIYSKESIYNKFTLYYYGDRNGENFELIGFSTESEDLYLTKEIKVGDSIEDLLSAYPMLIEDTWSKEGERYLYPDRFGMRGVFFEIEDRKISKIIISRLFD